MVNIVNRLHDFIKIGVSLSTLNSNLCKSLGNINPDSSKDFHLDIGRYLLTFSQTGMWKENGLAYLDITGFTQGSYFSWICGNLSSALTITINTDGITITASSALGTGVNISRTKIK